MDTLLRLFPISTVSKPNEITSTLISIAIYLVAGAVLHLVLGLFTWLPLIGTIVGIIRYITDLYCAVGIILSIVRFFYK